MTRITPAGAGKTTHEGAFKPVSKDHPRRCGENAFRYCLFAGLQPSPPQVRGKRKIEGYARSIERITPAGAGKTPTADGSAVAM